MDHVQQKLLCGKNNSFSFKRLFTHHMLRGLRNLHKKTSGISKSLKKLRSFLSIHGKERITIFPPREILVSDIPAGDGKIANIFYSVVDKNDFQISFIPL